MHIPYLVCLSVGSISGSGGCKVQLLPGLLTAMTQLLLLLWWPLMLAALACSMCKEQLVAVRAIGAGSLFGNLGWTGCSTGSKLLQQKQQ